MLKFRDTKIPNKTENGEQEVSVEKIQSEERTNEFYKRAEAVKPNIEGFSSVSEKTQHLKVFCLMEPIMPGTRKN